MCVPVHHYILPLFACAANIIKCYFELYDNRNISTFQRVCLFIAFHEIKFAYGTIIIPWMEIVIKIDATRLSHNYLLHKGFDHYYSVSGTNISDINYFTM